MGRDKNQFKKLLKILPEGWEDKAKELGAFQRGREIKTPEELLRLILIYLTEGKSMAGTSAITNLSGEVNLSKIAVFKRIQNSGDWLEWMSKNIYRQAQLLIEKPQWLKKRNVLAIDGSKDEKGGKDRHCYMLHFCMDLFTFDVREFLVTDVKTGEKLSNFKMLSKGDIIVADRAYGTLTGIAHMKESGADYLIRLRGRAFNVYDEKGQEIDLMKEFSGLKSGKYGDVTGYCDINGEKVPLRVCAMRKNAINEYKGMNRLRKSTGNLVSTLRENYNKYIILITSVGKEASAEQLLELYRVRWQIEIAFKRLKSIFSYNSIPARKPENIKTWFYGKLLLAALCETLVNTGRFSPSRGSNKRQRKIGVRSLS